MRSLCRSSSAALFAALILCGCGGANLRLSDGPVAFRMQEVEYLRVDGETFHATVFQPEGAGPFPALLDVHGGGWIRSDVRRDEHVRVDKALAAMGIVVVAIDFRHDARHHYPDSVADVNVALRWLRANAGRFNALPRAVGAFGASTGAHLVLLNSMRPADPRYAAMPLPGSAPQDARPDYIILAYPPSDTVARRAYNQAAGNEGQVNASTTYFSAPGSVEDGNPQMILDRREPVDLPPALLLQGTADGNGPEMQQRFAESYRAAGGRMQLELFPGAAHNFVNAASPDTDRAIAVMRAFIEGQLVQSSAKGATK